ncbi:MAG: DUF1572 family protein [Acidobacteria bacterium]|nr:DUF1572 family protein [Acidobacteriota bacterium]MBI3280823.1 DUF1572 family protein [Acidobacteriota bacterium]
MVEQIFLQFSADKLRQLEARDRECLSRLTYEQAWARDADAQNAVGNLVLHLCGNLRQWIISAVGGKPDIRMRDREFAARGDIEVADLQERLRATVEEAAAVIESLPPERLAGKVRVQNYEVTVLEAIYHVVEHFAQHTGQIIFATKLHTRQDLGFYRHLQQPKHAEPTP